MHQWYVLIIRSVPKDFTKPLLSDKMCGFEKTEYCLQRILWKSQTQQNSIKKIKRDGKKSLYEL